MGKVKKQKAAKRLQISTGTQTSDIEDGSDSGSPAQAEGKRRKIQAVTTQGQDDDTTQSNVGYSDNTAQRDKGENINPEMSINDSDDHTSKWRKSDTGTENQQSSSERDERKPTNDQLSIRGTNSGLPSGMQPAKTGPKTNISADIHWNKAGKRPWGNSNRKHRSPGIQQESLSCDTQVIETRSQEEPAKPGDKLEQPTAAKDKNTRKTNEKYKRLESSSTRNLRGKSTTRSENLSHRVNQDTIRVGGKEPTGRADTTSCSGLLSSSVTDCRPTKYLDINEADASCTSVDGAGDADAAICGDDSDTGSLKAGETGSELSHNGKTWDSSTDSHKGDAQSNFDNEEKDREDTDILKASTGSKHDNIDETDMGSHKTMEGSTDGDSDAVNHDAATDINYKGKRRSPRLQKEALSCITQVTESRSQDEPAKAGDSEEMDNEDTGNLNGGTGSNQEEYDETDNPDRGSHKTTEGVDDSDAVNHDAATDINNKGKRRSPRLQQEALSCDTQVIETRSQEEPTKAGDNRDTGSNQEEYDETDTGRHKTTEGLTDGGSDSDAVNHSTATGISNNADNLGSTNNQARKQTTHGNAAPCAPKNDKEHSDDMDTDTASHNTVRGSISGGSDKVCESDITPENDRCHIECEVTAIEVGPAGCGSVQKESVRLRGSGNDLGELTDFVSDMVNNLEDGMIIQDSCTRIEVEISTDTEIAHKVHMDFTRTQNEVHMDATQTPDEVHTDATQTPDEVHRDATQTPDEVHRDATQTPVSSSYSGVSKKSFGGLRELEKLIGCSMSREELMEIAQSSPTVQRERHDRKVKTPAVVEPPQELWTRSVTHAGGDIMNTANKEKLVTKVLFGDEIDNSLGQKEHPELSTNTNSRKSNSCSADACDLTAPGSSVPMAIVAPLTSRPSDSSVALTMSSPPRQLRAVPLKRKLFQVNWDSRRRKKDDDTDMEFSEDTASDLNNSHNTSDSIPPMTTLRQSPTKILTGKIPKSGKKRGHILDGSISDVDLLDLPSSLACDGDAERCKERDQQNRVSNQKIQHSPEGAHQPIIGTLSNLLQQGSHIGELVWAKLGQQPWWPAIVIPYKHSGSTTITPTNYCWVLWFGDHKISKIQLHRTTSFASNFMQHASSVPKRMLFMKALGEVLKECAIRLKDEYFIHQIENFELKDILDDLLSWARKGFYIQGDLNSRLLPSVDRVLPDWVVTRIEKLWSINSEPVINEQTPDEDDHDAKPFRIEKLNLDGRLSWVKNGNMSMEEVCLGCEAGDIVMQHPYFRGGLCQSCKEDMLDSMFLFGDDGINLYCTICSNGGEMFVCDVAECSRVYCTGCISLMVHVDSVEKIRNDPEWKCYLCTEPGDQEHGILERKLNWRNNVMKMYQPNGNDKITMSPDAPKRPIRVLSLFDGIGTGKVVLDALGIDIEVYYASEVDSDAIKVAQVRHGSQILHVGDITALNYQQISKLCPIDLVIGGSPCNEFSIANPARKGLDSGSGLLFFEYNRVLSKVRDLSRDRHVFWLFENVWLMPKEVKDTISRFLECEPAMWDAKHFSAQQRRRYFWGNIPGLYCPQGTTGQREHKLDDSLMGARRAKVTKIRTVTTMSNSLMQGKQDDSFPVQMGDTGDTMWIPELESVFGFPPHYTDVHNLPPTRRQKLIGKAWSIPCMKHMLTPLKQFYTTSELVNAT